MFDYFGWNDTQTDFHGSIRFGNYIIIISYIGYIRTDLRVHVSYHINAAEKSPPRRPMPDK